MKKDEKPTTVATEQKDKVLPLIQKPQTAVKEVAIKKEMQPASHVERILNNVEVLLSRRDNRALMLETLKKLKAFDPGVTESACRLTIEDKHGKFSTTSSEAMKLVIANYTQLVQRKLDEVESDIRNLAESVAS